MVVLGAVLGLLLGRTFRDTPIAASRFRLPVISPRLPPIRERPEPRPPVFRPPIARPPIVARPSVNGTGFDFARPQIVERPRILEFDRRRRRRVLRAPVGILAGLAGGGIGDTNGTGFTFGEPGGNGGLALPPPPPSPPPPPPSNGGKGGPEPV